jgi:UDP-N-acetylmuramoylalanine--D-glutamate ligase
MRVLVIGLGMTGESLVRHFAARNDDVTVIEDAPAGDAEHAAAVVQARALGARVAEHPGSDVAGELGAATDLVVPSPGVAERHPAISAARREGVPVRSEIDLAAELAAASGGPALVAVTGTNGKTTVTTLTAAMLDGAGMRVAAAGNIGRPLLEAVQDDVDIVVAEVSSFQLEFATEHFRPRAAALLNIGADHLDWHRTLDAYARAKANAFAFQHASDALVFNADDPVVAGLVATAPGRRTPFSIAAGAAAGARVLDTAAGRLLVAAGGTEIVELDRLPRRSPPDVANALAASALALDLGAPVEAVRAALIGFTGLDHRFQIVAEHGGVRYVDDSKATNVHATVAAVQGASDVVLIAGGRNKGLDLSELRAIAPRLRGVVTIGEAGAAIEEAFTGLVTVVSADSMRDAVHAAAGLAQPGDTVLLSPACASFDWYPSYAARGDDFSREVRDLVEVEG